MTPIRTATETVMSLVVAGAKVRLLDKAAPIKSHRKYDHRLAQWRSAVSLSLFLMLFFCLPIVVQSQPVDPHALFEEQCGRCHDHAGTFARETLIIEDGEVVGRRSGKRVLDTLTRHFGRLSDAEAGLIEEMFRRQIGTGGLYAAKCRFCHDAAKDLARQTLTLSDGHLIGRYTGRAIDDFLGYHGRLTDDEQRIILDMLAWHLATGSAKAHE